MSQQAQNAIDQNKIQQFMDKAVGDISGSSTVMLVILEKDLACIKQLIYTKDMLHKMNIGIRKKRRDVIICTRNKYSPF
jgi:hypothetical protein